LGYVLRRPARIVPEEYVSGERSISEPILHSAAQWLQSLERSDARYLILYPDRDRILIRLLESRPEWQLNFLDQEGLLFVRNDARPARGALAV
jgi:hypothetical protein